RHHIQGRRGPVLRGDAPGETFPCRSGFRNRCAVVHTEFPCIAAMIAMALSPAQATGHRSETRAALWLQGQGLRVLERNLLCRAGEIDLVALDGDVLVFVEVRHRGSASHGGAAAS